ncbi:MAG: hypothetical protein KDI31_09165 [Pseudomonadales bacterium]|nr:hypothetical protein [Pseudomonadales bacterium]
MITADRVTRPATDERSIWLPRCSWCAAALLWLLIGPVPVSASATPHEYRVQVADDLSSVLVRAQFAAAVSELQAEQGRSEYLRGTDRCDTGSLRLAGNRILAGELRCLEYEYPLQALQDRRNPPVAADVRVTTPAAWLWRPSRAASRGIQVTFVLPPGIRVSVPWQALGDGRFVVSDSPGSSTAIAVFGRFEEAVIGSGNAAIRVALIDGPQQRLDRNRMLSWLGTSIADVASVGGRFPSPGAQVIVQPVPSGGRSAVPFGYVIRDGGESVRFFVDASRSLTDLDGDWTATHEFSHLLLPYVRSREKWISEGFSSYYQNVLLARRGIYSPLEAWQRLHRAFTQADAVADPPVLSRIDERPFRDMRMLIYWSGAAMALMADVRLRELSAGHESLDSVLARLAACCLPSAQIWRGEELFSRLDSLSTHPVFIPLYRAFVSSEGMPDLRSLYTDLGLETAGPDLRLRDDARLASIRSAIMQGSQ